MVSGVNKALVPQRRTDRKKSLSGRLSDGIEITSAITSEKGALGLKSNDRKTEFIKRNYTFIVSSKTTNKD